jgi:hypothetical protein
MSRTTPEQNKALVLEALDTLFKKLIARQHPASGPTNTSSTAFTSNLGAEKST